MSIACKMRPIGGEVLLPDGYRRCEYLEGTGTQYIDTELSIDNNSEINCTFESRSTEYTYYEAIFGTRTDYSNGITLFYPGAAIDSGVLIFANTLTVPAKFGKKTSAKANKTELKCGALQRNNNGSITGELTNMLLFCVNTNGAGENVHPYYHSKARIYSFSISRNNQLQLNYIPCLDDNGEPCMFDTVSRTPYYNKGTDDFLYKLKTPLPHGYYPMDYLESTGTQYIDTGFTSATVGEIVLDAQSIRNFNNGYAGACTAWDASDSFYIRHVYDTEQLLFAVGTRRYSAIDVDQFTRNKIRFNKARAVVNGQELKINADTFVPSSKPFFLFKGGTTYNSYVRIFSSKLYDTKNRLVRDFITCLDETGKPCMIDTMTRKPFYNAATTGPDFVAGMNLEQIRSMRLPTTGGQLTLSLPHEASIDKLAQAAMERARENGWELTLQYAESDVPAGYRKLDFLESTGTQYIDTGVKLSNESEVESRYIAFDDGNETQTNYYLFASRDLYNKNAFDYMAFYRPYGLAIAYCGGDGTTARSRNIINTTALNTVHILKQNANYIKVDELVFSYPFAV